MELKIGDNEDSPQPAGNPTDLVENVQRALENPQIRGFVTAMLENQGLDPQQFGLTMPDERQTGLQEYEEPQEVPEPSNQENQPQQMQESTNEALVSINSAEDIIQFIDQIAQMSPMGYQTKLELIHSHVEENKEEIEKQLRQNDPNQS